MFGGSLDGGDAIFEASARNAVAPEIPLALRLLITIAQLSLFHSPILVYVSHAAEVIFEKIVVLRAERVAKRPLLKTLAMHSSVLEFPKWIARLNRAAGSGEDLVRCL